MIQHRNNRATTAVLWIGILALLILLVLAKAHIQSVSNPAAQEVIPAEYMEIPATPKIAKDDPRMPPTGRNIPAALEVNYAIQLILDETEKTQDQVEALYRLGYITESKIEGGKVEGMILAVQILQQRRQALSEDPSDAP